MLTDVAATHVGRVRAINEDRYICLSSKLFVVADGMGGHAAGEIASALLISTIQEVLALKLETTLSAEDLAAALRQANQRILDKAAADEACSGMGTTASILYIHEGKGIWAHVGDSRIYCYRQQQLQQVTHDHSFVADLLAQGSITEEEAQHHPQRNLLTRAVGVGVPVQVDTGSIEIEPGDVFLLCTDGLTNMVSKAQIKQILSDEADDRADRLVEAAMLAGGTDNITVIVVEADHV